MIITTARKPSSKTRTFCKHLSRFTGLEYVTRGKTSLSDLVDEPFLIVGEYKGNPASFNFFSHGRCILSIRANVSLDNEIVTGKAPVIEGDTPLACALREITGFKTGEISDRIIRVNDRIEFMDKGEPCIILKVLDIRGEGIA